VLFGSDFPFIDQRMSLGRVVCAPLTDGQRQDVLSGNARRLFRWRPLPGDTGVEQ
jgi:predicted TIM-barrel fold metal-dependent hydrolase